METPEWVAWIEDSCPILQTEDDDAAYCVVELPVLEHGIRDGLVHDESKVLFYDVWRRHTSWMTPLGYAITHRRTNALRVMLLLGFDPDKPSHSLVNDWCVDVRKPLYYALMNFYKPEVELLLCAGACYEPHDIVVNPLYTYMISPYRARVVVVWLLTHQLPSIWRDLCEDVLKRL